jgi:hypothetical protein
MITQSFIKAFLFLVIISITPLSAQNLQAGQKSTFIDNVQFGGGIGLSFGNDFFSGTLAPVALYQVTPIVSTGLGLNLTYSSFRDNELLVYGGSLITIVNPLPEIQLSAEFEQLRVNQSINNGSFDNNYWYPALFLGFGYTTGPVTVGIRYDVIHDENKSIYANAYMPFVRVLF